MTGLMRALLSDERGATAIEYGLIASLIAIASIQAMEFLGTEIAQTFSTTSSTLASHNSTDGGGAPEPAPADAI